MTRQNKILTAVLSVIVALLIAIISVVSVTLTQTSKAKADSNITFYTEEELEQAREDGYIKGVGDKEYYENKIAELQQTIIDNDLAWQTKYNAMVEKYETEIKRLNTEIARLNEYCRTLESYIVDFNFDINGLTNSKAALELQVAAYESIVNGLEADIAHWTTTLNNLPENLDKERAEIESYTLQIQSLEKQLVASSLYDVVYEMATEWYDKSKSSPYYYIYLCPDGKERRTCSEMREYLMANYGFQNDTVLYYKDSVDVVIAPGDADDMAAKYAATAYREVVGLPDLAFTDIAKAEEGSIFYLIRRLRLGYFYEAGLKDPNKNDGYGGAVSSFESAYSSMFFTFFRDYELPIRHEEVKTLTSQIDSVKSLRDSTQEYIDGIIEQKAVANHIITTAQSSLVTVNNRIAELRELIASLPEG